MLGLGAAEAIDYTVPDLAEAIRRLAPDGVAGLIDTVNRGEAFAPLAALVRDGGRAATTLGAADEAALAERGIVATNVRGTPTTEKLTSLAELAAAGTLRVPIQATFALADYGKAVDGVHGRHARQAGADRRLRSAPGYGSGSALPRRPSR